ncbi:epoxide hydrolase N-terminal domain-containing protein [Ensifer sp.]|uniref:epoxide hydrolase N-terminal domain-containing protein n=1 Tax=Ensifer sp. TaxID=1872086 RepID=UPI002E0E2D4A|nr:epoxide hydrolase N-terminal domain-containing protein [Ensifer sp.]
MLSRCALLLAGAAAAAAGVLFPAAATAKASAAAPAADAIRPFRIAIPEAALDDLRARLAATRWPDAETVSDRSQGGQLEKLRPLALCWQHGYDWRTSSIAIASTRMATSPPARSRSFTAARSKRRFAGCAEADGHRIRNRGANAAGRPGMPAASATSLSLSHVHRPRQRA